MPKAKPKDGIDLMKLVDTFDTQEKCRAYLEALRWPKKVTCPRCQSVKVSRIHERGQFDCDSCRYQFSVTAGTIFHDSHLGLPRWLVAVYLMCESKKGISANQMKRTLGVSYKTAWYLCHRIRAAMKDADTTLLDGTVEVDETWVGGRRRGVGSGNRDHMTMVMAAVKRGGGVRLKVDRKPNKAIVHGFIRENVADHATAIYTDENPSYHGVGDANTKHETVNHRDEEWVRGDVHTNTVEGVFSLFKRSIVGSFHQVSKKHLPAYLEEFEWRFNNRKNPFLFRDTLLRLLKTERLPYQELVKRSA